MARMTREFSLVLVGSGMLTAGYFAYPPEEIEAKQDEAVKQQLAGNQEQNNNQQTRHRTGFIWLHPWVGRGYGSRPPAMGGGHATRGGFGGIGRGSVGG